MKHRYLRDFARDESGATASEYALVLSLISMTIIGSVVSLGTSVDGFFTPLDSTLATVNG